MHCPIKQQLADQVVIGLSVSDHLIIGFGRLSAIIDRPSADHQKSPIGRQYFGALTGTFRVFLLVRMLMWSRLGWRWKALFSSSTSEGARHSRM